MWCAWRYLESPQHSHSFFKCFLALRRNAPCEIPPLSLEFAQVSEQNFCLIKTARSISRPLNRVLTMRFPHITHRLSGVGICGIGINHDFLFDLLKGAGAHRSHAAGNPINHRENAGFSTDAPGLAISAGDDAVVRP